MRVLLVENSDVDAGLVADALAGEPALALERATTVEDAKRVLELDRFDAVLVSRGLSDTTTLRAIARSTPVMTLHAPEHAAMNLEALREARRAQEDILAALAHKLRTPLTAILGWTHLLRTGKVNDGKQAKAFATIERNAQTQVTLIEEMLDRAGIVVPPAETEAESGPPSRVGDQRELEGLKVLLVEDDDDTRALLTVLLVTMGASVSVASSAREGMAFLKAGKHDVIVSDIEMNETSGYTFLQTVRSLPAETGGRTPAIALTAHTREADRDRAMEAGFDEHLAKPIGPALLVKAVLRITALRPPFAFD